MCSQSFSAEHFLAVMCRYRLLLLSRKIIARQRFDKDTGAELIVIIIVSLVLCFALAVLIRKESTCRYTAYWRLSQLCVDESS